VIPPTFIQDLLNRVDIVEVVGSRVQLKKAGANFLGLCPFHAEKSPSFTVSPNKQFYHCFGCGKHGSAIGFLMDYAGIGFVDAIKDLAQNAGMTVPEREDGIAPERRAEQQVRTMALSDVMNQSCQFYRAQLRQSQAAIAYLKQRGLSGEIAAKFGLGYAPDNRDGLRKAFENYDAQALAEAGMVIDRSEEDQKGKRYDRFRDRIMFPIRNTKGQVIGFGGRVIGQGEPKYLNSPETPLFQKGSELYGLFEARQAIREAGYVLVVEGYMDVVALAQLGCPQTVATLGTACTPVQVQKLMRQSDLVIFAFDGDAAGRRAARRALEASLPHVGDNKSAKFLFLPSNHDPDSYIREFGAGSFDELVRQAMPLSEFMLKEAAEGNDLRTSEGRARTQFAAKPLLQAMKPSALRLQLVRDLAKVTQSAPAEIETMFALARRATPVARMAPRSARPKPVGLACQILRALVAHPGLSSEIDPEELAAFEACAPDSLETLKEILSVINDMGANVSFASLSDYLREAGNEFDSLVADIAQGYDFAVESARSDLKDALKKMRVQAVNAEMEKLSSADPTPEVKIRLAELMSMRTRLAR
jgi:DNA primase